MGVILFLFVALCVILGAMHFLREHILHLIIVLVVVGLIIALGPVVIGVICGLAALFFIWDKSIRKSNDERLKQYLEENCTNCGCVDDHDWRKILPSYIAMKYESSFYEITQEFTERCEARFFQDDKTLSWLHPITDCLREETMLSVYQMEQVPNTGLQRTHSTPDGKLIADAMEKLCIAKEENGEKMLEKISLKDEAVRRELNLGEQAPIPDYYKAAFKFTECMIDKYHLDGMETEEISLDDL